MEQALEMMRDEAGSIEGESQMRHGALRMSTETWKSFVSGRRVVWLALSCWLPLRARCWSLGGEVR